MASLWIVHSDARWRDALRQLVGRIEAEIGSPNEPNRFEGAARPRAVLLGVAGSFEAELEFAHRFAARLGPTPWVLLGRARDRAEILRLFDALPAAFVPLSSDAASLRRGLAGALVLRPFVPVQSVRERRDQLAKRFWLFTDDLDPGLFLPATDPARATLPLLVRGESGIGRTLVARYLQQATSRDLRDAFVVWRNGIGSVPQASGGTVTICVEDIDHLDLGAQGRLRDWIEHGPPADAGLGGASVRWMATASPEADAIDPALALALGGHELWLPPLRERLAAIDNFTHATRRRFAPEALAHLRAHPWPGNLRELDAVLRRTLAATSADPISPDDLQFDPGILDSDDLEPPNGSPTPTGPPTAIAPEQHDRWGGHDARPADPASSTESRPIGAAPSPMQRLSAAIAHEVGNPLVGIRTYASLLATHFDDPDFRAQFRARVDEDTRRIESVVGTLSQLGAFGAPARVRVDATALLSEILERARPQIRERRLVVLEELDREHPFVLGDAALLRFALELLVEGALAWVPARGAVYVSTRRRPAASGRPATLRIELRIPGGGDGLGFDAQSLAVAVAEEVARAHGGTLESESGAGGETTVQVDIPTADDRT